MIKFSKGFTIIELIVVIAIISVLGSIVTINVSNYINKSKNAAAQATVGKTIFSAETDYFYNNGSYGDSSAFQNISSFIKKTTGDDFTVGSNGEAWWTGVNNASWCVCVNLLNTPSTPATSNNNYSYCADSRGKKMIVAMSCNNLYIGGAPTDTGNYFGCANFIECVGYNCYMGGTYPAVCN